MSGPVTLFAEPHFKRYTDYHGLGWMTGTGRVGNLQGDGNADVFTSSDNTHPTQAGHDYRGWRHASALAAQMPILGGS